VLPPHGRPSPLNNLVFLRLAISGASKQRRMTQIQKDESDLKKKLVLKMKRPISERRLQANRANAKRSTGPKTEAGKAASRRNALKHGILSRSIDLPLATPRLDRVSLKLNRSLVSEALGTDSVLQEIDRIWVKLARVVVLEKNCAQHPDGLTRHGRLVCRYERMLTKQLHARIRECAGIEGKNLEARGESL
jgi:hypothetical protein